VYLPSSRAGAQDLRLAAIDERSFGCRTRRY
jgi:hypothetical protein